MSQMFCVIELMGASSVEGPVEPNATKHDCALRIGMIDKVNVTLIHTIKFQKKLVDFEVSALPSFPTKLVFEGVGCNGNHWRQQQR